VKKQGLTTILLTACLFFAGTATASLSIGPELGKFKPRFAHDILGRTRFEGNSAFQWGAKSVKRVSARVQYEWEHSESTERNPSLFSDRETR